MTDFRQDRPATSWVKSLFDSLSLSLFVWLIGVIVIAFGVYAIVSVRAGTAHWNHSVQNGAQRYSELIRNSTRYGMLLNRKEDVHQIIRTIAREQEVRGVRIYDKQGVIIYSADETEIGRTVDRQAEACIHCHPATIPLSAATSVASQTRVRIFGEKETGRTLGLISPIPNERECSAAPCHAHPIDQTVLGVLDVQMSLAESDAVLAATRRQIFWAGGLTALIVGIAAAAFILVWVRRPVGRLIDGASQVAGGDLTVEIPVTGRNEISQLAGSFNRMTRDLRQAREELTRWSDRLEDRLAEKTEELGRTQRQVVHMEKMASLGKLSATVAHELNNPLAGILNYAKLTDRTLREDDLDDAERTELSRYLSLIQKEASRCGDIVRNLLLFARQTGVEPTLQELGPIIDRACMLVRHHLEMAGVEIAVEPFAGDDRVVCDGNQIQQALVALLVNAVEAMPRGGHVKICCRGDEDSVEIVVQDAGTGIPADLLPHIFEPFFSTKDQQQGVGLGLAVVYGIIQRHGGEIQVRSDVDVGTTFLISLPRRPDPEPDDGQERQDAGNPALQEQP